MPHLKTIDPAASLACQEYYDEWLQMLEVLPAADSSPSLQVLVFSLDGEYFGFLTNLLRKVMKPRTIYPIPNNSKDFILGLVKANRRLQLTVDLSYLIQNTKSPKLSSHSVFLFLEHEKESFIFPVTGVVGVHAFMPEQLKPLEGSSKDLYLGKLLHEKTTIRLIHHTHLLKTLGTLLESSPLTCGI